MNRIASRLPRSTLLAVIPTLALSLATALASAGTTYRLTDLGTLGGAYSQGERINSSGQATGGSSYSPGELYTLHAFFWDGLTLRDLGVLGGLVSIGVDVNDAGQVAGASHVSNSDGYHAFLWDGSTMRDLDQLGYFQSYGWAINASGEVVGDCGLSEGTALACIWDDQGQRNLDPLGLNSGASDINASGVAVGFMRFAPNAVVHAAVWKGHSVQDLGTFGGSYSEARRINDAGQVVGNASTTGDVSSRAFLWEGTTLRDLGTLGGSSSFASAVNASGQVTGSAALSGDAVFHAFLWDGSTMRDVGFAGGGGSVGYAINRSAQVAGDAWAADGPGDRRAFLWDGTATNYLDDLIETDDPLRPYVKLLRTRDMNDRGQVLVQGLDSRTGEIHAYIASPVVPIHPFAGFFSPVDNVPTRNLAKAGSAIPVKFSLGGDRGLDIFATGYPMSTRVDCETSAPLDAVEETMTAGSSELTYASGSDQYQYVWKTNSDWAGTCRQLIVRLNDLTEHVANFQFK
jgi:probable HAF family extracellular repeat protein